MATRQELLEEEKALLLKKQALMLGFPEEQSGQTPGGGPQDMARHFNKTLVDLITLPTDLINAGLRLPEVLNKAAAEYTGLPIATSSSPQLPNTLAEGLTEFGWLPDHKAEGVPEQQFQSSGGLFARGENP